MADDSAPFGTDETRRRRELHDAVEARDLSAVRRLLDAGADPNWTDLRDGSGLRPLEKAIQTKQHALMKVLLAHGAAPAGLHLALAAGDAKAARLLVEAGADPNIRDEAEEQVDITPLMQAARDGNLKAAKLLLELGADPNRVDEEGRSALAYARLRRSRSLVKLLEPVTSEELRARAKRVFSEKALRKKHDQLIEAINAGDFERVRALLVEGLNPDAIGDYWGKPGTVAAAEHGRLDILRFLIESAGASPDGANGWIPLVFAARFDHPECAEYLLDRGADVNAAGAMGPALADAAARGSMELVKLLLDRGADPEVANCYGHDVLVRMGQTRRSEIKEDHRAALDRVEPLIRAAIARKHAGR